MRETTARGHESPPVAGQLRRHLARRLPILGLTIAALTVLGPFGTFQDMSLTNRLTYWGGLILAGSVLFDLVILTVHRVLTGRFLTERLPARRQLWLPALAMALLTVSLVQTAVVATLEQRLRRPSVGPSLGLMELYGYVLVVTLLVSALPIRLKLRDLGLVGDAPAIPPAPHAPDTAATDTTATDEAETASAPLSAPPASSPAAASFLDRIPPRLGRELLALEMEDHYVRVHTMAGSDLVLMRLRDAIAALSGIDGLQVHRSHWVAATAVAAVERKPDGKLVLRLTNGLCVPVSRSHAAAVRAAGWVERTET